jgi:sugar phosphate isomerase/epimerase
MVEIAKRARSRAPAVSGGPTRVSGLGRRPLTNKTTPKIRVSVVSEYVSGGGLVMRNTRRTFLGQAALGAAVVAPAVRHLHAAPLGLPVGTQVYPVRKQIGSDFDGTLRNLASMGYRTIEMCSPQGYKGDFAPLAELKPSELRQKIRGAGLACESSHYQFRELKDSLPQTIEYAKELGLTQMILASFGLRKGATLDDWARAADDLNKAGEQASKTGMQIGFHNHDIEFTPIDGTLIYDKLTSVLDPKLVKMQYQVAVGRLGFDAPAVFQKYSGRFISLHLQDWSPADKRMVAIGQGVVDWKKLFSAAKQAGVKNYFVEVGPDLMKDSVEFLKGLNV